MTKMRAACGGGAVCSFLFDPSAPLRSAHATLPRLPFPGLLRNGPPMARLRRLRPAFFCRRQRQGAIPFIQREALREGPEEKTEVHMGLPSFSFRVLPRRVRGKTHFSACKRASVPRKRVRCSRLQISAKRLRLLADQNSALPVVRGCSSTSRMFETPVRYMTMRSKPRP